MSAFKEMVAEDMGNVFLNLEEFGEEHDLNGVICPCVVESPNSREKFQTGKDYDGYEVIHGIKVTIHAKKADVGEMPVEDQLFSLDEEEFIVDSCTEHMGMLTINLKANISGLDGAGGW